MNEGEQLIVNILKKLTDSLIPKMQERLNLAAFHRDLLQARIARLERKIGGRKKKEKK